MAATYKDIQRLTGLSLATISKYFNGGQVRKANRMAIEEAIKELDFHVNEYARSLKSRRSHLVGGLIPELNSTFNTTLMADVEEYLRQHGYGFMVCDCRLDKEMEKEALEFLLGRMVDGIITIPFDKSGEHLKLAKERGIPVVLMDRLATDFVTDAVVVDNRGASRMAVEEFMRLGHREIAIINGPEGLYTMRERMDGFRQTLEKHQLPIEDRWMIWGPMTVDGGYEAAKKLFAMRHRPTALFCANYEITLGTIMAMNELGIRMPEDISLIGFDNLTLSGVIKPTLTMIVQPMQDIAHQAAKQLIDRMEQIETADTAIITRLQAQLVKGKSIKNLTV